MALADQPVQLLEHVFERLLCEARARTSFRSEVQQAVQAKPIPALQPDGSIQSQVDEARRKRAANALQARCKRSASASAPQARHKRATSAQQARRKRVQIALLLMLSAPEFLVQP